MSIYSGLTGLYNVSADILPPQYVPLKEKLEEPDPSDPSKKTWAEKNMDALESIGRSQYNLNLPLIENYEMIKGRFIYSHYFEHSDYKGLISQLSEELELPSYLRHYDIISQVVNTMSGEWQKRPDTFRIRQVGDKATNEYLRAKEELITNYIFDKINSEIDAKLMDQGIDPYRDDFESDEEAQEYYQEIDRIKTTMTPPDIQKYMDHSFMTNAEIWAENHKEHVKEFFNLSEKEKVEFEDMCVADRSFRHFFLNPASPIGYTQETWNPINVFFHKSPDVTYVEDGDYVGRIFSLSINTIIDRYGHLMTKEDFELLQGKLDKNKKKWNDHKYSWVYDNYLVPFKNYPEYSLLKQGGTGIVPHAMNPIPEIDGNFLNSMLDQTMYRENEGFYFVTEAYWKSQKKLIKLTYLDEETGVLVVKIVDEFYDLPKHFKESKKVFTDDHDLDTYCITYVNEVWKGVKINAAADSELRKDLYIDIRPNEFQFKGNNNIYGCRLPVCGQIFSARNSRSMSIVDLMKPYQIAYNVAMNQAFNLMEKEIGMFIVLDVNMFPNRKDWGGDSWDKWMMFAKNTGLLPADTSPANIQNSLALTGGHLPKVLDMNLASQMVSRINLCKFFEEQALKQVGFNQYRVGNYSSQTTATGIQQGVSTSYAQTESYFTNFSNYLRRCMQMDLDIGQYVESQKEVIPILYTKDDFSKAFIQILGVDLLLSELGVFVSSSQEHIRQLEMIRQFALENNTAGLDPVSAADIIMMNTPKAIRSQLDRSYNKILEQQQQAQQQQQQAIEMQGQIEQAKLQEDQRQHDTKLQNNLDVAYIQSGTKIMTHDSPDIQVPEDNSGELVLNQSKLENETNLKREELDIQRENIRLNQELKRLELLIKQNKIDADLAIQAKETESVKILKGKQNKK